MGGIVLTLGSGPNLGTAIASRFAHGGYKVAQASRSRSEGFSGDGVLNIQADLSDPEVIRLVFEKTVQELGGAPNVVIYNREHARGGDLTFPSSDASFQSQIVYLLLQRIR